MPPRLCLIAPIRGTRLNCENAVFFRDAEPEHQRDLKMTWPVITYWREGGSSLRPRASLRPDAADNPQVVAQALPVEPALTESPAERPRCYPIFPPQAGCVHLRSARAHQRQILCSRREIIILGNGRQSPLQALTDVALSRLGSEFIRADPRNPWLDFASHEQGLFRRQDCA